jgi:hypothetical protein
MSALIDTVPKWVRIAVGVLAVFNIIYGVMSYFDFSLLYHAGTGIDMTNTFIKSAGYEFAARNLAIGIALCFVTIIKGAPEALVILTIVRALIEVQTIIQSIVQGNVTAMILVPIVFLVLEVFIIKTLVGVITDEEKKEKGN